MSSIASLLRGTLASAAFVVLAGPAGATCLDVDSFRQVIANAGQSIHYAATVQVRDAPTPAYIAIGRDGTWTAYFVYRDVLACVIAAGRRWTEQGKIPPADLRPGG